MQLERRGSYGFDAPYVPLLMALGGTALLVLSVRAALHDGDAGALFPALSGLGLWLSAASYTYTTRTGKFRVWTQILKDLNLRGDEHVLDVGCGRGAVLCLAAQAVPRGKVTGIDLWSTTDQSGNSEVVTRANAQRENVSDRIELQTGDMRDLPYSDETFDLVVSSLAIHNVPDEKGRAKAIAEALRVLKHGGRLVVADFRFVNDYAEELRRSGATQLEQRNLGWRFWYGGPWASTKLVTAQKP